MPLSLPPAFRPNFKKPRAHVSCNCYVFLGGLAPQPQFKDKPETKNGRLVNVLNPQPLVENLT